MSKKAVIYARYSSHGQREESIEGQLKVIKEWAKKPENDYMIIDEYIDRKKSGKGSSANRKMLNKMLEDSKKGFFDFVLVYAVDRFGRDLRESVINEHKLNKNNTILLSATEDFGDNPAGKLQRNLMLSIAQYYSDELSEKIKRGISISTSRAKHIGGKPMLGYKVNSDTKLYEIDPATAPVVLRIFELNLTGLSLKKINETITDEFGKSFFGNPSNSINKILKYRGYTGLYCRYDTEIKDGMPRIISDDLFEQTQIYREKTRKTPARARAREEYLLTSRIFCGYHDHSLENRVMMVGVSGTSKTGAIHNYYTCKHVWRKQGCSKKNVRKHDIENLILSHAKAQLTTEHINLIAKIVGDISKKENNIPKITEIKRQLKDNSSAVENLMIALETGEHMDLITERLNKKKEERAVLEKRLIREQLEKVDIDENEIKFFLIRLRDTEDITDIKYKRAIIAMFIDAVFLYDDKVTIIYNLSDKPVNYDVDLINTLEKGSNNAELLSSYIKPTSPLLCGKSELMPIGDGFGFVHFIRWQRPQVWGGW